MSPTDYTTIEYRKREFFREHGVMPNAILADPDELADADAKRGTLCGLRIIHNFDFANHLLPILV